MDRRQMLGILGVSATGLAAAGSSAVASAARPDDDDKEKEGEHGHKGERRKHLELMGKCAGICNEAAHHSLERAQKTDGGGDHYIKSHRATMDCQAFCMLTAALMARHSEMAKYAHQACADACRDCAAACEGHAASDKLMAECVEICKECEKACRKMASGHGHDHEEKHDRKSK